MAGTPGTNGTVAPPANPYEALEKMAGDEGAQLLLQHVCAPIFFQKLANDWNIVPENDQQRQDLMIMAAHLRAAKVQDDMEKAAGLHGGDFFAESRQALEQAMGVAGMHQQARQEDAVKQAAFQYAQQPEIAYAALACVRAMQAQQLGQ